MASAYFKTLYGAKSPITMYLGSLKDGQLFEFIGSIMQASPTRNDIALCNKRRYAAPDAILHQKTSKNNSKMRFYIGYNEIDIIIRTKDLKKLPVLYKIHKTHV